METPPTTQHIADRSADISLSIQALATDPPPQEHPGVVAAALLGFVVVGWAVAIVIVREAKFAFVDPMAWAGVETASAFARLFAALILILLPDDRSSSRFRWLASGMIVLGVGWLTFGYLRRLVEEEPNLNQSMYGSLTVWTIAGSLFVIGLVPHRPPDLSVRAISVTIAVFITCSLTIFAAAAQLPRLVMIDDLTIAAEQGSTPLDGLTAWHWTLSSLPLVLALAAVYGTIRHRGSVPFGGWLMLALVLLAGAQLHNMLWPSAYTAILTTANVLRLGFAVVVVTAGTLALRRIATERAAYATQLTAIARLRTDFTSMVAHELGSPLSAIRGYTDILELADLDPTIRARTIAAIQRETDLLTTLVADVRASSEVERDDFAVQLQAIPLSDIINNAAVYAGTLPGNHPVSVEIDMDTKVSADRERIGQVLRNLLGNAARYSDPGTPIVIRAIATGVAVRVEVEDQGYGIHPDDIEYVFAKFGRGRTVSRRKISGAGLGLYLSHQIIEAHGSRLAVRSRLGEGSVFSFTLRIVA